MHTKHYFIKFKAFTKASYATLYIITNESTELITTCSIFIPHLLKTLIVIKCLLFY